MSDSNVVTEITTNSVEAFDARINNWAEGTLLTIDADGGKISIRGAIRPYASEYAKMLKKIHEKTAKMSQVERVNAAAELRLEWQGALEKAYEKEPVKESDFAFHLPGKDGKLVIVDETPFYYRDAKSHPVASDLASLTDKECKAVHALKDLKVGECVVVGYAGGILRNDVYVVIKANQMLPK